MGDFFKQFIKECNAIKIDYINIFFKSVNKNKMSENKNSKYLIQYGINIFKNTALTQNNE